MSLSAAEENAKTLGHALGLDDDAAANLLRVNIAVRAGDDASSLRVARHTVEMLRRTVAGVGEPPDDDPAAEVVVGAITATTRQPVYVGVTSDHIVISRQQRPPHDAASDLPEILLLIAACYAAGMAVRVAVGGAFPLPFHDTIRLPVDVLVRDRAEALRRRVPLGRAFLAGAGAIGNGFLWGLAAMDVEGELHVVDPKAVTTGNLCRCLWFTEEDVGQPKAERLVARAQDSLPGLSLIPHVGRLQEVDQRGGGAWLERLVVGVDSRRARRRLQEELPGEVFDASTTGIDEVVLHFNSAAEPAACLSCVYAEDQIEEAHERHVAETLGIEVADVRQQFVGEKAALRVAARHTHLDPRLLVGVAYDTLFKTLCATGQLGVHEGRTVLAPLAFVSVLAGAYLALELALRVSTGSVSTPFNYWRASPWTSPVFALQAQRDARPDCECCGNATIRATVERLWGVNGQEAT